MAAASVPPESSIIHPASSAIKRTDGGRLELEIRKGIFAQFWSACLLFPRCSQPRQPRSWGPPVNAFALWPATRRPAHTGRRVTPARACSHTSGTGAGRKRKGGETSFQREWSENRREKGQGKIRSPAPEPAGGEASSSPAPEERGPSHCSQANVSPASCTLPGKTRIHSLCREGSAGRTPSQPPLSGYKTPNKRNL
ncbi:uncharacterized protein [Gorilla gorilla gorilla]|uniref:uncharacterized protein n=1 Tax=Gorilla gorilla gorilla TaxID=9595 RepID=UPI00123EC7D9|nr:uncharacterized protein LOC109026938 [Gorilla gorilla gorilla]